MRSPDAGCVSPQRRAYGSKPLQFGDLYLPRHPGPHPVVILIHGGFWRAPYRLTLMAGLAEDLAQRGIAAWNIEYRASNDPGGGWPGTLRDVARAADYLATLAPLYALDLARVVPVGHSAGGQLALWLAARHRLPWNNELSTRAAPLPLTGVISLAGAADLELTWRLHLGQDAAAALLGGSPDELPERYKQASPASLLPLGVPQVLLHGTLDDRVPLTVSKQYARLARAAGDDVTLIELPGVDHFALIDATSAAWGTTIQQVVSLFGDGFGI